MNRVLVVSGPSPANVPQGLWRDIDPPDLASFAAEAPVSVILDGDPAAARVTADALAAQSYPSELVEVIEPASGTEPTGDVVIVLAAGTAPAPEFVAAHARWHQAVADAVSFGPVGSDRNADDSSLGLIRDLTRDLADLAGGHHLAAAEDSVGMRGDLYREAGGAGIAPPGLGRVDLAHRLHTAGAVFVAAPEAWASGPVGEFAAAVARACARSETLETSYPGAAALVALPPFRALASPRRHKRPALTVNVPIAEGGDALATIAGVLGSETGDLELRVQIDESHPGFRDVAAAVEGDPRAAIAPSSLGEACEAPFQVTVPPVAGLDPRTLGDLEELALGEDAGALHVTVPGIAPQDAMIEVVTTAAWRRAQRLAEATGEEPELIVARLAGERWVSGVEVSTRGHGIEEPQVTEHGPLAAATDLGHERNAHLRFRERANDLNERAATLAERTLAERLRARAERQAAERVEARLAGRG
jgi:hypothetical protein